LHRALILEACVENIDEAVYAQKHGATRLELCAGLDQDGTTPDLAIVQEMLTSVEIPVKVMVRPRAGNFVYTDMEFEEMQNSIRTFKDLNISGIVTGMLHEDHTLDIVRLRQLAIVAFPVSVTIHKCFDLVPDILMAIQQLKEIPGIGSILSSGQERTAIDGVVRLKKMLEACGEQLTLIVAGKVTQENLPDLIRTIGAKEYHGRRIV
jgi:copper homeostasis protein